MAELTKNTRKHVRKRFAFLIKYHTLSSYRDSKVTQLKDISGGGLSFLTHEDLEIQSAIGVSVLIPSCESTLEAEGMVVRVSKVRGKKNMKFVGVKFTKITAKDKKVLDEFHKVIVTEYKDLPEPQKIIDLSKFFKKKKYG